MNYHWRSKKIYIKADIKVSKDLIAKAHKQVVEKIKEIRQSYSKAVVSGRRSGSGKLIYEHYDKLVQIWGSTPNVSPPKFGVSADNFKTVQVIQLDENDVNPQTDCSLAVDTLESAHDLDLALPLELLPDEDNDDQGFHTMYLHMAGMIGGGNLTKEETKTC